MGTEKNKIKITEEIKIGAGSGKKQTSSDQFSLSPQSASDVIEHTTESPRDRRWDKNVSDEEIKDTINVKPKEDQYGEIHIDDILDKYRNIDIEEAPDKLDEEAEYEGLPEGDDEEFLSQIDLGKDFDRYFGGMILVWDEPAEQAEESTCSVAHEKDNPLPLDSSHIEEFLLRKFMYYLENHKNSYVREYFNKYSENIRIELTYNRLKDGTPVSSEVPYVAVHDINKRSDRERWQSVDISIVGEYVIKKGSSPAIIGSFFCPGTRYSHLTESGEARDRAEWRELTINEVENRLLYKEILGIDDEGDMVVGEIPGARVAWEKAHSRVKSDLLLYIRYLREVAEMEIDEGDPEKSLADCVSKIDSANKGINNTIGGIDTLLRHLLDVMGDSEIKKNYSDSIRNLLSYLNYMHKRVLADRRLFYEEGIRRFYIEDKGSLKENIENREYKKDAKKRVSAIEKLLISKFYEEKIKEPFITMGKCIERVSPNNNIYGRMLSDFVKSSLVYSKTPRSRAKSVYSDEYGRSSYINNVSELGKISLNVATSENIYDVLMDAPETIKAMPKKMLKKLSIPQMSDIYKIYPDSIKYFSSKINEARLSSKDMDRWFPKVNIGQKRTQDDS